MKSFTSLLAWLLLAAVLAVPSFLFYNWWSNSKKQVSAEVSSGPAAPVFPKTGDSSAASAPAPLAAPATAQISPETPPAAPALPVAAAAAQAPASAPAEEAGPIVEEEADGPVETVQTPKSAQEPPPEASTAAAQGVEVSTAPKPRSVYAPKKDRDPVLSPEDYRTIREERIRREESERAQSMAENVQVKQPGPETRISLQGIVGNAAIINGDMYTAGQTVRGVKILKVGADYVICDYKGRRFRKVLR